MERQGSAGNPHKTGTKNQGLRNGGKFLKKSLFFVQKWSYFNDGHFIGQKYSGHYFLHQIVLKPLYAASTKIFYLLLVVNLPVIMMGHKLLALKLLIKNLRPCRVLQIIAYGSAK